MSKPGVKSEEFEQAAKDAKTIGGRVASRILEKGLSVNAFTEQLKKKNYYIDRQTVMRWVKDLKDSNITVSFLKAAAEVLDCDIQFFLGLSAVPHADNESIAKQTGLTDDAISLLRDAETINPNPDGYPSYGRLASMLITDYMLIRNLQIYAKANLHQNELEHSVYRLTLNDEISQLMHDIKLLYPENMEGYDPDIEKISNALSALPPDMLKRLKESYN